MSTSVAKLLKKETFDAHAEAERLLAPKLTSIQSYNDYALVLKMFYGFLHPLEKCIGQNIAAHILADIDERRSSLLILKDLAAIKHSTEHLTLCRNLPKISSSLEALGIMYVLEGSTLGGRMIGKMLRKHPVVIFNDSNLTFFNGYQENTGSKWTYFLSVVDSYEDGAETIVASASETFNCLTKWMKESL